MPTTPHPEPNSNMFNSRLLGITTGSTLSSWSWQTAELLALNDSDRKESIGRAQGHDLRPDLSARRAFAGSLLCGTGVSKKCCRIRMKTSSPTRMRCTPAIAAADANASGASDAIEVTAAAPAQPRKPRRAAMIIARCVSA
eukprot:6186764-Pleurochrysis_carterae.AAC.2